MTCRYYQKVHSIRTQTSLKYHGLSSAWDIEDLVTLGSQIKVRLLDPSTLYVSA